jgi:hypothetical protein
MQDSPKAHLRFRASAPCDARNRKRTADVPPVLRPQASSLTPQAFLPTPAGRSRSGWRDRPTEHCGNFRSQRLICRERSRRSRRRGRAARPRPPHKWSIHPRRTSRTTRMRCTIRKVCRRCIRGRGARTPRTNLSRSHHTCYNRQRRWSPALEPLEAEAFSSSISPLRSGSIGRRALKCVEKSGPALRTNAYSPAETAGRSEPVPFFNGLLGQATLPHA